ncbi:MAG: phosphoribosyltransferase, partial [Chloroflexi bacterium]|nr:phosphoribosyltransferase [Chloroflexota bacterium]
MGKLRIVSHGGEPFRDRQEAGRLLANELSEYRGKKAVVLGIPRGGVIVAEALAHELAADLDIVLAHKLRAPLQSELAIGSVAEDGKLFLNEAVIQGFDISEAYIHQEKTRQLTEIGRRTELIRRV